MIRIVFLVLLIAAQNNILGQSNLQRNYKTIGVGLHTNGWGAEFNYFSSNLGIIDGFTFSYHNYNHIAERKANTETITNTKMVLNKINNLYFFRPGVLKSYSLGTRKDRSNIGVNAIIGGGPSIGIFKPIFIEYSGSDSQIVNLQEVRYNPRIHNPNQIFDRSSFLTGLSESNVRLGLWAKAGLRFDWGSYESNFKAIEIGINANYIPASENLIYSYPNQNIYANMYLTLHFGSLTN